MLRYGGAGPTWNTFRMASLRFRSKAPAECHLRSMYRRKNKIPPLSAAMAGVVVITGCTTGLGYEAAKAAAKGGATVVLANRNVVSSRAAAA